MEHTTYILDPDKTYQELEAKLNKVLMTSIGKEVA